jgi:hypothetical protein
MAYDSDHLLSSGPGQWTYSTADARATVLGAGYFASADLKGLKYGHVVRISSSGDEYAVIVRKIETSGAATAELVGADVVGSTELASAISTAISTALATAFAELPTTDPASSGALWNDEGVLKISEGA